MHFLDPNKAKQIGIIKALMLEQIRCWAVRQVANGQNNQVTNTRDGWRSLFPYLNDQQIGSSLISLAEDGLLEIETVNGTRYYRIIEGVDVAKPKRHKRREIKGKGNFAEFWAAYPRKTQKQQAKYAYEKALDRADHDKIMEGVKRISHITDAHDKKFCPYPATWLNGSRWEDEDTDFEQEKKAKIDSFYGVSGKQEV